MDSRQMKMMSRSRENEMSNQECSTSVPAQPPDIFELVVGGIQRRPILSGLRQEVAFNCNLLKLLETGLNLNVLVL